MWAWPRPVLRLLRELLRRRVAAVKLAVGGVGARVLLLLLKVLLLVLLLLVLLLLVLLLLVVLLGVLWWWAEGSGSVACGLRNLGRRTRCDRPRMRAPPPGSPLMPGNTVAARQQARATPPPCRAKCAACIWPPCGLPQRALACAHAYLPWQGRIRVRRAILRSRTAAG